MPTNPQRSLFFGPAGVPLSAKSSSTLSGIERVSELGLGCMELQFVRGVRMTEKLAHTVNKLATEKEIVLTAHAPYFINLNAHEPEKITASQEMIMQSARIAEICGARGIVFHAAYYLGDLPSETYNKTKKHLQEITGRLKEEGNKVMLRPELTGKGSQFGDLDEILNLSAELEGVAPCIDFAHWHARNGEGNTYLEFSTALDKVERKLGKQALHDIHIHVSGIAYGKKGEIKHLPLAESDFRYHELLQVLHDKGAEGVVICESPLLEQDAVLLQQSYAQS